MAGLSVILESKNNLQLYSNVINKTSLLRTTSSSSTHGVTSPFLEQCYLCGKKLQQGNDIYMYRGDRAFCSVECRCRQICMDEESGKPDNCSIAAAMSNRATVRRGSSRTRMAGKGREFAGGYAY